MPSTLSKTPIDGRIAVTPAGEAKTRGRQSPLATAPPLWNRAVSDGKLLLGSQENPPNVGRSFRRCPEFGSSGDSTPATEITGMSQSRDPYYEWLGIPPKDQPANHYRLLGLELFEDNPDVIAAAADRQMSFVKDHESGPDAALTQRILNELSAARHCLLTPAKKTQYDAELRSRVAPDEHVGRPRRIAARSARKKTTLGASTAAAAVVVVLGAGLAVPWHEGTTRAT